MHRVFVYGTIKKGFTNHDRIFAGHDINITPAWTYGELYDLKWGFPAMTVGKHKVIGELLEFDNPEILQKIVRLEGYKGKDEPFNFYDRVKVNVFVNSNTPIIAWIYLFISETMKDMIHEPVRLGVWKKK